MCLVYYGFIFILAYTPTDQTPANCEAVYSIKFQLMHITFTVSLDCLIFSLVLDIISCCVSL